MYILIYNFISKQIKRFNYLINYFNLNLFDKIKTLTYRNNLSKCNYKILKDLETKGAHIPTTGKFNWKK